MKSIGAALISLALVAAMVPEFSSYRAERRLHAASALFRSLIAEGNAAAGQTAMLDLVASIGDASRRGSSERLPAVDPRRLSEVGGRPAGRGASALSAGTCHRGAREIDLNLGRAYELAGNRQAASAAVLRAVWVSPALISALPEQMQTPLKAALAENARRLGSRRLAAPPPLPEGDRSD